MEREWGAGASFLSGHPSAADSGEKTLFFGTDCTAASETQRLGSGDVDRRMTDYPGAATLLWAVAEIDLNRGRGEAREHLGPADRLGVLRWRNGR